jgi:hypothetical protein
MSVPYPPGEIGQLNIRIDDLKDYVGDHLENLENRFTSQYQSLDVKVDTLNETLIKFMAKEEHEEKRKQKKHDFRLMISGAVSALAMACSVVIPLIVAK